MTKKYKNNLFTEIKESFDQMEEMMDTLKWDSTSDEDASEGITTLFTIATRAREVALAMLQQCQGYDVLMDAFAGARQNPALTPQDVLRTSVEGALADIDSETPSKVGKILN